jgi:hypothetical protein
MKEKQSNVVVKETGTNRWASLAHKLGVSFMAAVFAGIIFGLLLRLVMGIIAVFFPHLASGFTVGGTLILVILGLAVTLANSIVYTVIFQKSRKSWVQKGLYFGLFSFLIYGIPLFLSNPNNELFGPQASLGVSLFSALFFIGALILVFFIDTISSWVDHSNRRVRLTYVSFAILIIPAITMLVNLIAEIFYEMLPKIITNLSQLL